MEATEIKIGFNILEGNDLHFLAPHATSGFNRVMEGELDLLLGDIVDLDLCRKEETEYGRELQNRIVQMYGLRYFSGNHSLTFYNIIGVLILPNGARILATHGDIIFYKKKKFNKYRNRDEGSGFIRRGAAKVWDKWGLNFRDPKIKDDVMERAVQLMSEYDCTSMICGHSHRKEMGVRTDNGYTLQVLPKGLNDIIFDKSGKILSLAKIK